MTSRVKRPYNASRRQAAATQTRAKIIAAATVVFLRDGYTAATMQAVAEEAGVALATIYATVGPKPALFRLLMEAAISGTDEEIPVLERTYVERIRKEPDARRKIALYAGAMTVIQQRLAPLYEVVTGAKGNTEVAGLWRDLLERRARNMPLLVENIAETGRLRPGLTIRQAADDIWVLNSTEVYVMLTTGRGWSADRYRTWLSSRLQRLLLSG